MVRGSSPASSQTVIDANTRAAELFREVKRSI
jgi:hypothetical protein